MDRITKKKYSTKIAPHSRVPWPNRVQICLLRFCPSPAARMPMPENTSQYSPHCASTGANAVPRAATAANANEPLSSPIAAEALPRAAAAASPTTGTAALSTLLPIFKAARSVPAANTFCSPSTKVNSIPHSLSAKVKQRANRFAASAMPLSPLKGRRNGKAEIDLQQRQQ